MKTWEKSVQELGKSSAGQFQIQITAAKETTFRRKVILKEHIQSLGGGEVLDRSKPDDVQLQTNPKDILGYFYCDINA